MEVRVDGLRVFRGGRLVLDVPALSIGSGRVTAVLGPNGAGKSTLLRTLAGLEHPAAGRVRVGARGAGQDPRAIAFAFQEPVFVRGTVRENLELGPKLRGIAGPDRTARVEDAARACGIEHVIDRSARRLSGGEAQRANLARALALRAPVTLLDEPLSGFDAAGRLRLLRELPRLLSRFTSTTVLVTHDRGEAMRVADDLVLLAGPGVVASGPKRELFERPANEEAARLLGYLIVERNGERLGVPHGSLTTSGDGVSLDFDVESIVEAVSHREAVGRIGTANTTVRLPPGFEVHPGTSIRLVAEGVIRLV